MAPFGKSLPEENPSGPGSFEFNLRFPGQYLDKETNLFYNINRDYDPQTGRYIQSDPIGFAGGINPYAYVMSNPLRWADRLGLAIGDFPPPPPGYDPRTWTTGQWDDGKLFVKDPRTKTTYTCHPEDEHHWRHWDKQSDDGDDDDEGRWPRKSKKPWPGQKRAPYGDQSASDPSGDAPPWQPPPPPAEFSNFPGFPVVPMPNGPLPGMPPVRVPLAPIFVP